MDATKDPAIEPRQDTLASAAWIEALKKSLLFLYDGNVFADLKIHPSHGEDFFVAQRAIVFSQCRALGPLDTHEHIPGDMWELTMPYSSENIKCLLQFIYKGNYDGGDIPTCYSEGPLHRTDSSPSMDEILNYSKMTMLNADMYVMATELKHTALKLLAMEKFCRATRHVSIDDVELEETIAYVFEYWRQPGFADLWSIIRPRIKYALEQPGDGFRWMLYGYPEFYNDVLNQELEDVEMKENGAEDLFSESEEEAEDVRESIEEAGDVRESIEEAGGVRESIEEVEDVRESIEEAGDAYPESEEET